jgi:putative PIN family toxin of toxin-antitoxin system
MSLRVVFDTSTLVSAAIRPDSIPDQALQRALGFNELCASAESLEELERVLKKERFDRYAALGDRMLFLRTIRNNSSLISIDPAELTGVRDACRDLTDTKFLELCLAASADVLVSSDHDLLVLHPWRGISILTPAQFLAEI